MTLGLLRVSPRLATTRSVRQDVAAVALRVEARASWEASKCCSA
jgi:hypothetical protein